MRNWPPHNINFRLESPSLTQFKQNPSKIQLVEISSGENSVKSNYFATPISPTVVHFVDEACSGTVKKMWGVDHRPYLSDKDPTRQRMSCAWTTHSMTHHH